jgi:hypothetical protein
MAVGGVRNFCFVGTNVVDGNLFPCISTTQSKLTFTLLTFTLGGKNQGTLKVNGNFAEGFGYLACGSDGKIYCTSIQQENGDTNWYDTDLVDANVGTWTAKVRSFKLVNGNCDLFTQLKDDNVAAGRDLR